MEDLDTSVIRTAHQWWRESRAPALITVARTWGSSPRPPGSMMAICEAGQTVGSVSGGCIEDDLVERIRQGGLTAACPAYKPSVRQYGVSTEQAHSFGLPCGGTIELVIEPVSQGSALPELLDALEARRCVARVLDLATGQVRLDAGRTGSLPQLDDASMVSYHGPTARLILIGAGDLSRFMAEMAIGMGFEVFVCDPRAERASGWTMPGVPISAEMPDDIVQRLQPDARTAVVALTHDPKLDDLALIDALQTSAFYIGAIGSRRNSSVRRQRLREHFDLDDAALVRLRSPAGLYIGSKTPAQIALSIMAEVVAALNGIALHPQAG